MSTIDALLDAAKAATGASNDSELAARLGVRPSSVSNYRKGVSLPNAVVCATLAGLTGEPLVKVIGIVGEARAISREEKAVWRKLAAMAMALCLAVGFSLPHKAQAAVPGFDSAHAVYIMRNAVSGGHSLRGLCMAMAAAVARLLPPSSHTRQGRARSMIKIDPHDRIDLTGPWAGFGFQGGHMFTPEGHQLEPGDMAWWSLTCNIAREWRLMMAEARTEVATRPVPPRKACATPKSSVIYLAEALRIRRERRLGVSGPGTDAEPSNVVYMRRGPRPRQRV